MNTTESIVESFDTPHSCQHCQKYSMGSELKSQQSNKLSRDLSRLLVRYTYAESISGARGGCRFFQYCFPNWDASNPNWLRTKSQKRKSLLVTADKNGVAEIKKDGKTWRKMIYRVEGHWDFPTTRGTTHSTTDLHWGFAHSSPINKHPGSKDTFELVRRWKAACDTSHHSRNCRPLDNVTLPTRVIDARPGEENPQSYLSTESEVADYVCLSYCWGGDQATKLTKDVLKERATKPGIPFHELPQTLKDAITATREIGFRYLWVDSLCICQDSPEDITREIARMPGIYRGAYLTICASRAHSSAEGFLHPRTFGPNTDLSFGLPFKLKPDSPLGRIVLSFDFPDGYLEGTFQDPIHKRGWTLQERFLSRRILDYSTRCLLWKCGSAREFDSKMSPLEPLTSRAQKAIDVMGSEIRGVLWDRVVENYTKRSLIFLKDRIFAIAGIAEQVATARKDRYVAGLWTRDLPDTLLWKVTADLQQRPKDSAAPSWSWTSVVGAVTMSEIRQSIFKNYVELTKDPVFDVSLEANFAPYGGVRRACLTLQGNLVSGKWIEDEFGSRISGLISTLKLRNSKVQGRIVTRTTISPDTLTTPLGENKELEVWLLPVLQSNWGSDLYLDGLILRPATNSSMCCFRRVGAFTQNFSYLDRNDIQQDVRLEMDRSRNIREVKII